MKALIPLAGALVLTVGAAHAQSAFKGVEGVIAPIPTPAPRAVTALPLTVEDPGGVSFKITRPTTERLNAYDDAGPTEAGSFQRPSIHNGQRSRRTRLTGFDVIDALIK